MFISIGENLSSRQLVGRKILTCFLVETRTENTSLLDSIIDKDMTQEDKQLLLKDLCARLPYLFKGLYQWKGNVPFDRELDGGLYDELYLSLYSTEDSSFKPYLRPMSSMTRDDYAIVQQLVKKQWGGDTDWLNAHHFDYRGLIEKGLAIEVTEENNPY